ncbi:MAG: ABC transporter permease [Candidatus Eisenbacteria bacterium]|nr:ABC transporter permease [Candidatus Eisenbacteria bacterium]
MFRLLVEKELRDAIGSPKFVATFVASAVLILLAFFFGARGYQIESRRYDAAKAENLRQLEGMTDWLQVQDLRIFLPPQPLAFLVPGIANDIGRTVSIAGSGDLPADGSRYGEEPVLAVFRMLDLDFLFQVVLTLFAIVLAHDAVCGEKERGTLRLAMSNAIPRRRFLLGKIVGTLVALLLPLSVPLLLGCLMLPLLGVPMTAGEWLRLALILGSGLALLAGTIVLSVLVSAATRRSSSAFLILLAIWIASVAIVPRASVLFAGRAVAVPSVDEIAAQQERLRGQLWTEDRRKMASFQPAHLGDPQAMVAELQDFLQKIRDERERKVSELTHRLEEERRNRQERQSTFAFALARISPGAVFSLAAAKLAGTSLDLPRRLQEQALAYQASYARFLLEKTGMNPGAGTVVIRMNDDGRQPEPIDPRELPEFQYRSETLAEVLPGASPDLALLALFPVLFLAVAVALFHRYDVR